MTDSTDLTAEWRRLLQLREDLSAVIDDDLTRIRERMRAELAQTLRAGIDEIGRLSSEGRPDFQAKRRLKIEWWREVLSVMDAPQ
jgi:hypothetical protein